MNKKGLINTESATAKDYLFQKNTLPRGNSSRAKEQDLQKSEPKTTKIKQKYIPSEIDSMTLREIAINFGDLEGMVKYVQSAKLLAEYEMRDTKNKIIRGELIDRAIISTKIIPFIDGLCRRLLEDDVETLAKHAHTIAMAGGEEAVLDIVKLFRQTVSKAIKDTKKSIGS